jgi:hypothetical protein
MFRLEDFVDGNPSTIIGHFATFTNTYNSYFLLG